MITPPQWMQQATRVFLLHQKHFQRYADELSIVYKRSVSQRDRYFFNIFLPKPEYFINYFETLKRFLMFLTIAVNNVELNMNKQNLNGFSAL